MNYLRTILYTFLLSLISLNASFAQCTHPDYNALVKFYQSTHGEQWKNNAGWKQGADGTNCSPCSWSFIKCTNNRVTSIDFKAGTGLKGFIPPEIGELTELKFLNIYREDSLSGSLPQELANLDNLEILKIRNTSITGAIPGGIFHSKLKQLFLSRNQLSGNIPAEVSNASNLNLLYLNYNLLSGEIPDELFKLTRLTDLFINDNQLSGTISPKIGQLRRLQRMGFGANQFSGAIPEEIGKLRSLSSLKMEKNQLSGPLPSSIKNLRSLGEIKLNENQLSGWVIGELASLRKLTQVQLQKNQLECFDEELKKLCARNQLKRSSFEDNKNPLSWFDFCKNDDYPYICNVATTDLNSTLSIRPNPSDDYILIEGLDESQIKKIQLRDQFGNKVTNYQSSGNLIDVSHLSPGLYLISLQNHNSTIVRKLIIK